MKTLPKFDPNGSSESQKEEKEMELQQTQTETEPIDAAIPEQPASKRKPRTRIQHERSQFVHTLEQVARVTGAPFNPPTLAQLADLSEDEYRAICNLVAAALLSAIDGIGKSTVPNYDIQIGNFRVWQNSHTQYFWWDDTATDALRRKLEQLGPGCEIIPCFAMSVGVKLPNGKLILINRKGEETKG